MEWYVDAGTTSSLRAGGRKEGLGVWIQHRNALAHAHSFSHSASHSVRQTKKSNILQEDSILPGGWDIIPLHRVGGAKGGRRTRVRGFVSTAEYPSIHARLHFSVDVLVLKAIITHKLISAADKCILLVF